MKKHPVYRLIDGQIMCQVSLGGRWTPVDDETAARMLETFVGLSAETIRKNTALPIAKALDGYNDPPSYPVKKSPRGAWRTS